VKVFVAISCYKSMPIEFVHSVMTLIMNRPVELEVIVRSGRMSSRSGRG
jgi:hypothetical protein